MIRGWHNRMQGRLVGCGFRDSQDKGMPWHVSIPRKPARLYLPCPGQAATGSPCNLCDGGGGGLVCAYLTSSRMRLRNCCFNLLKFYMILSPRSRTAQSQSDIAKQYDILGRSITKSVVSWRAILLRHPLFRADEVYSVINGSAASVLMRSIEAKPTTWTRGSAVFLVHIFTAQDVAQVHPKAEDIERRLNIPFVQIYVGHANHVVCCRINRYSTTSRSRHSP